MDEILRNNFNLLQTLQIKTNYNDFSGFTLYKKALQYRFCNFHDE